MKQSELKQYDFHTHQINPNGLFIVDPRSIDIPNNQFFFLGPHPWFIEQLDINFLKDQISSLIQNKYFIGIGEIGLDKSISVNYDFQLKVFYKFLNLAEELKVKAITIHCVKAYSDIIACLKKSYFNGVIILHDFNGNSEIIKSFLQFNTLFSVGSRVLRTNSKIHQTISKIPLDRLIIESDENKVSILNEVTKHIISKKSIALQEFQKIQADIFYKIIAK